MLACARGGAQAQIDALPARHRAVLDAYADGVNRALSARRPWELRLVRHRPEPWKAADCVLMGRLIGHVGLAQTQGEVERWLVQMLNDGVTLETLDELFGGRLAGFDPALLDGLRIEDPLIPQSIRWHPAVPAAAASNNWVLAPQRTQSGSAILAGDPHLEVNRLPAVWYEAVLEGPDGWLAGASMPGAPAILVGRNEHVAWSVTYAYADVIDSWVEDCRDGCFRRDDGWQPFDVREEVIHRRGGEPERVRFYDNLHGTLGGDPHVPGRYLATRWAGRDGGGRSLAAALDLARARDAEAAGELLSRLEWAFNWVLADRDGAIVYRMSGRIPRRREGAGGLLPLAGWRPADDWQGFHDAAELPQRRNPPSGWLATANEDLNALGAVAPINLAGAPYRAERLAQLLGARDDWTIDALRHVQMDAMSPQARRFMAVLAPLLVQRRRPRRPDLGMRGTGRAVRGRRDRHRRQLLLARRRRAARAGRDVGGGGGPRCGAAPARGRGTGLGAHRPAADPDGHAPPAARRAAAHAADVISDGPAGRPVGSPLLALVCQRGARLGRGEAEGGAGHELMPGLDRQRRTSMRVFARGRSTC